MFETLLRVFMANPQPDHFTRISNELLEQLAKVKICGESMQIFFVVLRKTYGYNKKEDIISFSQFSNHTNIDRSNCFRAIKRLEEMNLITVKRNSNSSTYSIQKDYDLWKTNPKKEVATTIQNDSSSLASVINTDNTSKTKSVVNSDKEVLSIRSQSVVKTDNASVVNSDNNKRKVKTSLKESLKKEETSLTSIKITSVKISSDKIKSLFTNHTKISKPNNNNHIDPVLNFIKVHPKELSNSDIMDCLISEFSKLDKSKGVYMKFLLENIGKSFGAKVEEIITEKKKVELDQEEVKTQNLLTEKNLDKSTEALKYRETMNKKIIKYSEFFTKNKELFSTMEKYEIEKAFKNKSIKIGRAHV